MIRTRITLALLATLAAWGPAEGAETPCLKVSLIGTLGGPVQQLGLPGPTTMVEFGDAGAGCRDGARLLFDVGRGAVTQLGGFGVRTSDIDAIFITHIHNDHTEGLFSFFHDLWFRQPARVVDVVCHDRIEFQAGKFIDCRKLVVGRSDELGAANGIDGPTTEGGEIALRRSERSATDIRESPSDHAKMALFVATDAPQMVWSGGGVSVQAVRSTHVPGHMSYRVDTPAGSVVIGGDAANDNLDPFTRPHSTSDQVEALAAGADILVHSAIHPGLGPGSGFPVFTFRRQSTAVDLGAMAERAGVEHLMLTHLVPAIGQDEVLGVPIPPLTAADWEILPLLGGFTGEVHVGPPGTSVQIAATP